MPILAWVAVLLGAAWRLPACSNFIYNIDESIAALMARTLLSGGVLYKDVADHMPPVTPVIYAAVFKLFGLYNFIALHWLLTLMVAAITALVFILAKKLVGEKAAILACAAFAVASYNGTASDMLALETGWVMCLFLLVSLWFYFRSWFFISGVCFALSVASKPISIFMLVVFVLFLFRDKKKLLSFMAGCVLTGLIFILYFAWHHALGDFYYYMVVASGKYVQAMPLHKRALYFFKAPFWHGNLLFYNSFLWYSGLAYMLRILIKRDRRQLFLLAWFAAAFFGASFPGRRFGHYFIFVLVPLSVMTGALWQDFSVWLGERFKIRHTFLCVYALILLFYPAIYFFASHDVRPPWHASIASIENNSGAIEAVRYLKENSKPGDLLFVWGFLSEVYIKTGLTPASRYIHANHLTGIMNGGNEKTPDISYYQRPGAWKEWSEDMERSKPRWVLDTSQAIRYYYRFPPLKFPELSAFLKAHYRLAKTFQKNKRELYRLYERKR